MLKPAIDTKGLIRSNRNIFYGAVKSWSLYIEKQNYVMLIA